jgi:hypothetical protein
MFVAFAELQTDMTELTGDICGPSGIPFREYRNFCMRVLFPNSHEDEHPVTRLNNQEVSHCLLIRNILYKILHSDIIITILTSACMTIETFGLPDLDYLTTFNTYGQYDKCCVLSINSKHLYSCIFSVIEGRESGILIPQYDVLPLLMLIKSHFPIPYSLYQQTTPR